MKEFKGKTAVITGAGNGFGVEFAIECAKREMKLVLADINEEDLKRTEQVIKEMGVEVIAVPTDVSLYEEVAHLAEKTVEIFGSVDLLFNNAGVVVPGPIWEIPVKDWEWIMGVNVNGIAFGLKAFIPVMLKQGTPCHIVNTASVAGLLTTPNMVAYHASKHASVALTESVAMQLEAANSKIGMSVFCPGFVQTDLHNCDRQRPERYAITSDEPYYQSPTYRAGLERAKHVITTGIPIDSISQSVFIAIEEERFYILTHPQYNLVIGKRVKEMIEGQNPDTQFFLKAKS
ncbi:SDR family NAD(P)-dependent oxidoreductase [Salipaludibacillus sp. CUR1]|uniref:SDR family NAD(P)-dependent oxidoreductase n=1 Tax=Salipaludibacillus sp. CUR1 TaxID=2820003 RepID=UPI001E3F2721|nr:SDR family NAD(P)-dependent oxidoreductase [Salipaludibacillus sp. CUR1]MCE7791294.1 SDR family NAD(P)-dependent oxidoreductase [Salipaludibacillus sp. CUR1]